MNESELALEAAKIAIEKQYLNLYADFIKVGIPSLIAIVSALVTYKISKNNTKNNFDLKELSNNHEEKLLQLQNNFDRTKKTYDQKQEFLLEIATDISEVYAISNEYLDKLSTKKHIESKGEEEDLGINKDILVLYTESLNTKKKLFNKINSLSLLLNDKKLINSISAFEKFLIILHAECSFSCTHTFQELIPYGTNLTSLRDAIFVVLSDIFHSIEEKASNKTLKGNS